MGCSRKMRHPARSVCARGNIRRLGRRARRCRSIPWGVLSASWRRRRHHDAARIMRKNVARCTPSNIQRLGRRARRWGALSASWRRIRHHDAVRIMRENVVSCVCEQLIVRLRGVRSRMCELLFQRLEARSQSLILLLPHAHVRKVSGRSAPPADPARTNISSAALRVRPPLLGLA